MSHIGNYCYINSKNSTNECEDPNYIRIYYNKDSQVSNIYSYGPPPSTAPGPLHQKNQLNPGDNLTQNMPYYNKDYPVKKNIINTQIDNNLLNSNSTLQYAHVGHNSKEITVFTEK